MPIPFKELSIEIGNPDFLESQDALPALPVCSPPVIDLLDALSCRLRQCSEVRMFPDLASLSFWFRRSHIRQFAKQYEGEIRLGRGLAFHIAPSNVPLNFAYTLAVGLLSGCANAVRLPSRDFPQSALLCREWNTLLHRDFPSLLPYVLCFRCPHDHSVLPHLSAHCDIRVLWGGNETIQKIRQLPLKPRALELPFADRYSLCVLHANAFLQYDAPQELAERFCQDAYFSGQWACTSPRVVFWLGEPEECDAARDIFWKLTDTITKARYELAPIQAVKKREQICLLASAYPETRLCPGSNHAVRAEVPELSLGMMDFWTGEGMFLECCARQLDALLPILTDRCQTVASFGIEDSEWKAFLLRTCPKGIDRITPLGSTMQFSPHWDGVDLIQSMSRNILIG